MQAKLTQTYVAGLSANDGKRIKVRDTLITGLILYVHRTGGKIYYLDYKGKDGKRTELKLGSAEILTVAQAREAAKELLARLALGEDIKEPEKPESITLGQLVDNYYAPWVRQYRKSGEQTLAVIKACYSSLWDEDVQTLSIKTFEYWAAMKMRDGTRGSSLNRYQTAIKAVLNWAVKRELITSNPLAKLERLPERDSDKKVRFLSSEERERFMKALDDREKRIRAERASHNKWLKDRDMAGMPDLDCVAFADHLKPLVLLSLNTGIRRNALFSLLWADVDFNTRTLILRASESKAGKTQHVPLNKAAYNVLQQWKKQSPSHGLIFPSTQTGKKLDNCNSAWEGLLKLAKIENFRWHDMRHDFASQLVMKGVDLNTVRELLGHADMKMTLRYAHLAPAAKMRAVELLDE